MTKLNVWIQLVWAPLLGYAQTFHLLAKRWIGFIFRDEGDANKILKGTPVWVKLPGLRMELWLDRSFWAIGDTLGKFILSDDSYKDSTTRSVAVAKILVEINVSQGLFESMELVAGGKSYTQVLDYVNFPFRCVRCHQYGHVLKDCGKIFSRQVWKKKEGVVYDGEGLTQTSDSPEIPKAGMGHEGSTDLRTTMAAEKVEGRRLEAGELVVGDISISLITSSGRQEETKRGREMDSAFFDFSPSHLQQLDLLWQKSAFSPGKSTLRVSNLPESSVDGLVSPVNHTPFSNCTRLETDLDSYPREEGECPMTFEGKEDSSKLSDDSITLPRGEFNSFEDSGQGVIIPRKQGGRHYDLRPRTATHDTLVSGGLGTDALKEGVLTKVGRKSNLKHAQEKEVKEVFQGDILIRELKKLLFGWDFSALDADGFSGGLITGWSQNINLINVFAIHSGLCTEVFCKGLELAFTLLNVYGPYEEKQEFWTNLLSTKWIKFENLIIAGHLNLTLHRGEIWGSSATQDRLADFFLDKFESVGWVDVEPIKVKPTWTNNTLGEDGVSKRLDRFLVHFELLGRVERYRSWVDSYRCSYHFPIYFEIGFSDPKPRAPYKYNPCWSEEFSHSLRRVKEKAMAWASERFRARDGLLKEVELRLEELYRGTPEGIFSLEEKTCVTELEGKKCKLLSDREKHWRIKSMAIWLQQGDQNTKYFHNYARFRENQYTIWELTGREGNKVRGFKDLAAFAVQHFNELFKEPDRINIGEIIKVVTYFPRMVGNEDNAILFREITKEELLVVLNALQKEKSPGPDGWSVEFYLDFFELLGEDLLRVIEEVRLTEKVQGNFNSTFIALIPKIDCPENFDGFRPISLCNCVQNYFRGRLIHEAIGIAQEGLHTIKNSHAPAVVIKLALSKAYDRPTRGLRQGCPLSPYLFLLVAEGLSRAIKEAKRQRILQAATGMEINWTKSALYTNALDDHLISRVERIFPLSHLDFNAGINYLGFCLKPNYYGTTDWRWLLSRIKQRISFWCNRWLSRGGRLILIKSLLETIPVFWHTMAYIPKGILEKIRKCCFNYLWKGISCKVIVAVTNQGKFMEDDHHPEVRLGVDAIMGCAQNIFLPEALVLQLQLLGRCTSYKIANPLDTTHWRQGWLTAHSLGLGEELSQQWEGLLQQRWNPSGGPNFGRREAKLGLAGVHCVKQMKRLLLIYSCFVLTPYRELRSYKAAPYLVLWGNWLARNTSIFEGKHTPFYQTSAQVIALLKVYKSPVQVQKKRVVGELQVDRRKSWGFFDGACLGPGQLVVLGSFFIYRSHILSRPRQIRLWDKQYQ
eukprot:Gb_14068 [translate_table: standard]